MAHFLEHAIFKGTDRLGPGYFDAAIEGCGGLTNAATSYDYAHFFITTASPYFSETLPLLSELLLHAAIPEDEFLREREVVFEEIRQSQDSPDDILFEVTLDTVYQHHPYRRPVLGTQESLLGRFRPLTYGNSTAAITNPITSPSLLLAAFPNSKPSIASTTVSKTSSPTPAVPGSTSPPNPLFTACGGGNWPFRASN